MVAPPEAAERIAAAIAEEGYAARLVGARRAAVPEADEAGRRRRG